MKLLEQLKKPELWAVLVPLIVSAGLFGFTDADTPDLAKAIPAFFSAIAAVVLAIQKQDGENKTRVETARSLSQHGATRGIVDFVNSRPQPEPETRLDYGGAPVHAMAWGQMEGKILSHDAELRAQRQRLNEIERGPASEVYGLGERTTGIERRLEMLEHASLREQSMGPKG